MCLYPQLIRNPKYKPTKKNGGIIPECKDERLKYIAIGCGECSECRQKKARNWAFRLEKEIRNNNKIPKFITLTYNDESLEKLRERVKNDENRKNKDIYDGIVKESVRLFSKRWEKKYKKTPRYFIVSERGKEGTERLHLHAIFWMEKEEYFNDLQEKWGYGIVDIGEYRTGTIGYLTKYIFKVDNKHEEFKTTILASKGIGTKLGKAEIENIKRKKQYWIRNGRGNKIDIPIYLRNKIFDEEEREKMWLDLLDQNVRFCKGEKFYTRTREEMKRFEKKQLFEREQDRKMGYKKPENYNEKQYKKILKKIENIK